MTGASRGIGAAIAERFAAAGAVVAVSARTVDAATSPLAGTIHETVERIRAAGDTAHAFAADLSSREDRERLVADVVGTLGPVDVLVNNAAVTYFIPVADFTERRMALMLEVQVTAPLHLAQLVLPPMVERHEGWILNISSVAARHPVAGAGARRAIGGTVYGMCKAALERFTTGLAAELFADNVAVNALLPTWLVPTPGTHYHGLVHPDDPNQRIEGPEVMSAAALALCSEPPTTRTGMIVSSTELVAELGLTVEKGDSTR